jgi:GT2 family glycosyltransferase
MEIWQDIEKLGQELEDWPKVAIIVLNWNGWRDTIECLESLQRLTYPAVDRIILVDNGSTDDSLEKIKAWARGEIPVVSSVLSGASAAKPVTWVEYTQSVAEQGGCAEKEYLLRAAPAGRRLVIIQIEENLGFAGGMNVGIKYAGTQGAEYVWLVNNDTVVAPDALTNLVSRIVGMDSVGIAGPLELDYYHPRKVVDSVGIVRPWRGVIGGASKFLRFDERGCANVELVSGFNMLVSVTALRDVGLMDEQLFLYAEDTEWCIRMRRKGWKLVYIPASQVWHKGSQSTGWGSPLMYYYTTRNQLRLFSMYFPYFVPCAFARSMLRAIKLLGHRKWAQSLAVVEGCLDWAMGRYGRASKYSPTRRFNANAMSLMSLGQEEKVNP